MFWNPNSWLSECIYCKSCQYILKIFIFSVYHWNLNNWTVPSSMTAIHSFYGIFVYLCRKMFVECLLILNHAKDLLKIHIRINGPLFCCVRFCSYSDFSFVYSLGFYLAAWSDMFHAWYMVLDLLLLFSAGGILTLRPITSTLGTCQSCISGHSFWWT